ncbi:hypothetical protein Emtol_1212 [Emticicia oligotrophica DSM 17448]|uniref:Lipocalin-like domain-containing protein n=1 Tax=Emticicia oligotrophica (strain DSM 17448 / CIP 109782 / MTCC 6937 / GPTSA100-15) TaxID=929562 RepID=A0ABN4AJQ3_EMTOG|nr:hypothetical protein [Emticicia oligotrophica]AFK02361.1 hypothetical protein Emtol_1212 [Emticicia oligotrophica DSM 17448]
MKKIAILFVSLFSLAITSCKDKTVPVSEKIKRSWAANIVKEGSTTVYTKGAASNTKPGYSSFTLNLLFAPNVTLKEADGNSFTGQYELIGDTKLVLKNLSPVPTGTGGTIEFTINSVTDTALDITRTSASQKTGGTINNYNLVAQ